MSTDVDNFFVAATDRLRGIDALLDSFFSFLQRRTDFYQHDLPAAKALVIRTFDKHAEIAREEKRAKIKASQATAEEAAFRRKQEELKRAPAVEEVSEDDTVCEVEKDKDADRKLGSASAKKATTPTTDSESDLEAEKPIGNGGKTDKYTWTQTLPTVDVYIRVPEGTKAAQCKVKITATALGVSVGGKPILDGELHARIKADDSVWLLEDHRLLHLTLEKHDAMSWWSCVMKGDPEIDTKKIVPENSKLEDLEPDLRQTVEKMMHDQEMKARGLPTSEQSKQAEIFESFKRQHPELDFSQAKMNWGGSGM